MSDSDKPVFKRSPAGQALHFTVTLMRPRELREWMGDSSPENGTYVALVVAPNVDEAVAIARAEVYAADKKDGAGKYIRDLPPPRPHDPPKLRFEPECYPVVFVQAGRHEVLYFGWQFVDHTVESVTATDKNGILASHTPAAEEPAGMTP